MILKSPWREGSRFLENILKSPKEGGYRRREVLVGG
jgi:hypothetical protein